MAQLVSAPSSQQPVIQYVRVSSKTRGIAVLIALFFGGIGVHRFYLNRPLSGVLYLAFCWTFIPAIMALAEIIRFLLMQNDRFDEKYNMVTRVV